MPNPVLTVDPKNELKFKGCFEVGCTAHVSLTNPSSETVLFKIKTNAPNKYSVRPNSGVLTMNSKIEIIITSQPVYVDPNEKHKHKFMIQSVVAPEGYTDIEQAWNEITQDQIINYKFNCVFETDNNVEDLEDEAAENDELIERLRVAWTNEITSRNEEVEGQNGVHKNNTDRWTLVPLSEVFASDLEKIAEKIVPRTQHDIRKLRLENLQLQEELLRLRDIIEAEVRGRHCYEPEKTDQMMVSIKPLVFVAFGMVMFGIAIGKLLM